MHQRMTDKNPHRKMGIFCAIVESLDKTSDMKVLPNLEIFDFDQESVKSYRVWFATRHPDHAWTKLPDGEFLEMIGAASDDCKDRALHPTCAGLLMIRKEYKITRDRQNWP